MPRHSRAKWKKAPEEMPSSATREVISIARKGGRITKKRIIEATAVDPRASPLPSPDDTPTSQVDYSQSLRPRAGRARPSNKQDMSKELSPSGKSCSVSVSAIHVRHVDTDSSASRPKSMSGSRTAPSSSVSSFVLKLPLKK